MEVYLILMIILMIVGSLYSLNAKDLLSAVISYGIVGFALVISFLLLQAPDLAIVQIVVEIITLIIMIAVIKNASREENETKFGKHAVGYLLVLIIFAVVFLLAFQKLDLNSFGEHTVRMAEPYIKGANETGSRNLVSGIILDFRAYDTLGEATVLFTAVIGILTVLRVKGKKKEQ